MTRPPDPENAARLNEASKVLCYEYTMFQVVSITAMVRASEPKHDGTQIEVNIAIESMAMHVRNLIEFFYMEDASRRSGYVLAEHFFAAPTEWRPHRNRLTQIEWGTPGSSISINDLTSLCNVAASHFTWSRLDDPRPSWRFSSLLTHFDGLMATFVDRVPAKNIALRAADELALELQDGRILRIRQYRAD